MKDFFQFLFSKLFLKQIAFIIGAFILLAVLALQVLKFYTRHGESVNVPAVKGLTIESASRALEASGLGYEIIDSVYVADKPLGTILEQTPTPDSKVKAGRQIYLSINTRTKQRVPFPDVQEVSYRQAKAMLESVDLVVERVEYIPSKYENLVAEARFKGNTILPGMRIEKGSGITLLVGSPSSPVVSDSLWFDDNGETPAGEFTAPPSSNGTEEFF